MKSKLIIHLINGKRIQRTRNDCIIVRNTKRNDKIITEFFDEMEYVNKCIPIPFAECPANIIKRIKGFVKPVCSTFAK